MLKTWFDVRSQAIRDGVHADGEGLGAEELVEN